MSASGPTCNRREFLRWSAAMAASSSLATRHACAADPGIPLSLPNAAVAIVPCTGYGPEIKTALKSALDQLGGIGSLVKDKTVTMKMNLTGTIFAPFLKRPAGESYVTHESTALALGALLFEAGARRIYFTDSTQSQDDLTDTLGRAGKWDLQAFRALGRIEFENTRNLGSGKKYAELKVPGDGLMFSHFLFNYTYEQTDVMVSLCKLKQHITTGVTLSMKNLFGITPNSFYGEGTPGEENTGGRTPIHSPDAPGEPGKFATCKLPGLKRKNSEPPTGDRSRVPRAITDICAARPIHLAVIDGICTMTGAEGPWCMPNDAIKLVKPGVIIAGFNPVATDAIGMAVMGYTDPRVAHGKPPFEDGENHLLLAERAGLGTADLTKIDVRGLPLAKAVLKFPGAR